MNNTRHSPIGATVLGYPRIGRERQLKHALEGFWAGRTSIRTLDEVALSVRLDALYTMSGVGLDSIPVNTFSWYDHMLDTSVLVGAVPERFLDIEGDHQLAGFDADRYFAMARGTTTVAPLEMTKWFDTNYHYLVPEIGPETMFALNPTKPLQEFREADDRSLNARPVVIGPFTFLALAKATTESPDGFAPLDRVHELTAVYVELLQELAAHGVEWVQIDEPGLVKDLSPELVNMVAATYETLAATADRPAILVATYFGNPIEALPALAETDVEAISLDLVRGPSSLDVSGINGLRSKSLVLGAIDGRNIWRADLKSKLNELRTWDGIADELGVSTSCSLLHVPYDVEVELNLEPTLKQNLAFADQKLKEVFALHSALSGDSGKAEPQFQASDQAAAVRSHIPGLVNSDVTRRLGGVQHQDRTREPYQTRVDAQTTRFGLPILPTTTIGSFPQTAQVRTARADLRSKRIDEAEYVELMHQEIREIILMQEDLGLDVLVHGEPERNDMVQYFAEKLEGYAFTHYGWVQSYGSRCVRPPILYGDILRPLPMTVDWAAFAQSLTTKPVKGMLTGPVTMLAWSFVRDDQPPSVTADQLALALRNEVADLEAAGIGIIQVDEPALRELLPIRKADQKAYLAWSVNAFRLATSGVNVATQIHTHLCYSEFGEIIDAIDGLDADVTSIEAARSKMELLTDVAERGFRGALGPGVYDIHSPRIPSSREIENLISAALASLPASKLWINPDCGLKTRNYPEIEPSLTHLVSAAQQVRAKLRS